MKKTLLQLLFCITFFSFAEAQNRAITGTVTDKADGQPLPGVSVKVKGSQSGTVTDANGKFQLNAAQGAVLTFTYIGYATTEQAVGTSQVVNIALGSDSKQLGEVVVTALGVTRSERSLGYAAQQIKSENLTQTKQADLNTALAGKVAGVQVLGGSGAKFGTSRIRIRGINSLSGGNPIYVVDGVVTDANAVNNDDIEALTVLKGPAATALYGQRASEGAIVITLKKGAKKGLGVDINQSTTFEKVYTLPQYQNEYGGGDSQEFLTYTYDPSTDPSYLAPLNGAKYYNYGNDVSWGPRMDGSTYAPWYAWDPTDPEFGVLKPFVPQPNNVRSYYNTGVTTNTNVALSKGGENYNFRVSYTNVNRSGITPNSNQRRNNISVTGDANLTKNLFVSANVNVFQERLQNVPDEGYGTQTAGSFNQWFHRDLEINKLKRYRRPDGSYTTWNIAGPNDLSAVYWDNPYTEAFANTSIARNNRLYGNVTAGYKFTDDLKLSVIARGDYLNRDANSRTASYTLNPSAYSENTFQYKEYDYVAALEYNHNFGENYSLKAGAFAETRENQINYLYGNTNGGLAVPDFYNLTNSLNNPTVGNFVSTKRVNSIYGFGSFGYKDYLFLDVNIRNDVSSALPTNNNSYLYGGLSGSFVFTELMAKNNILSFGKLRASIAKVGSDLDPYQVFQTYNISTVPYGRSTVQLVPNTIPNQNLRPTLSTSYEFGTELHFLKERIRFDFNYYSRNTKDQILQLPINGTTGYSVALINAGSIKNHGYEISIGGTPVKNDNLTYTADLNFAINRNKVVSLYPGINNLQVAPDGGSGYTLSGVQAAGATGFGYVGTPSFSVNGLVGRSYGQLIGGGFTRDAGGNIVVDADGFPIVKDNVNFGSMLPNFTGGFTNNVTYKGVNLGFSFDFQYGGKFVSVTQANLAGSGLSEITAGLNENGRPRRDDPSTGGGTLVQGVHEDGTPNTTFVDTQNLYSSLMSTIWENWLYDATYVKLREVSLGYTLPKKLLGNIPVQSVYIALVSQNPWLIYTKNKGIDPSQLQTSFFEGGQLPATRTLGFNVKLNF